MVFTQESGSELASQGGRHSRLSQDVLSKVMMNAAGSPMTVAEATLIADNALEHTVRCVLAALQAPEILKSTQGDVLQLFRDVIESTRSNLFQWFFCAAAHSASSRRPKLLKSTMGLCWLRPAQESNESQMGILCSWMCGKSRPLNLGVLLRRADLAWARSAAVPAAAVGAAAAPLVLCRHCHPWPRRCCNARQCLWLLAWIVEYTMCGAWRGHL